MATLYEGKMAELFDTMYQTFIDYNEEFDFYSSLLKKNNCKNILEIGSGTGNLAVRFANTNWNYQGLDYSNDMIAIAKKKNPNIAFIQGDMRDFKIPKNVEAILMTGRTSSYIISNADFTKTLNSIARNLQKDGLFLFDFIDASRYIPYILEHRDIQHDAIVGDIMYTRIGNWLTTTHDNFLLDWKADYYAIHHTKKELISSDFSTVRVFTLNEVELFLKINGFELIEVIDRKTYAYDTYVIVARKLN